MKKFITSTLASFFILFPLVASATTTDFFSDSGHGSTTTDGYLDHYENPGVWTSVQVATTSTSYDTDGTSLIVTSKFFTDAEIRRIGATIDTSALGSSAIIDSAKYCFYPTTINEDADSLRVVSFSPASYNTFAPSDYDKTNFGTSGWSADIPTTSLTLNATNCIDFNSTGISNINLISITSFGLRYVSDVTDTPPAGSVNNDVVMNSADAGTHRPYLEVTYHTSGGSSSSFASVPSTSTGALQNSTGSLVIAHVTCEAFDSFSGGTLCSSSAVTVEIPAIRFFANLWSYLLVSTLFLGVFILIMYEWLVKGVWRWFWRLITGRHPEGHGK